MIVGDGTVAENEPVAAAELVIFEGREQPDAGFDGDVAGAAPLADPGRLAGDEIVLLDEENVRMRQPDSGLTYWSIRTSDITHCCGLIR